MLVDKAKGFIIENARQLELEVYRYFFENGPRDRVIEELARYQNEDGGFGHALEADNWNENSNPIATNDAIILLYRIGALEKKSGLDNDRVLDISRESNNDRTLDIRGEQDKDSTSSECSDMINAIIRYLESHNSFDEEKRRWLFAIDSNKEYPHAIWWEKNDGDGIQGYNPTVLLASFLICFSNNKKYYADIVNEAIEFLQNDKDVGGDAIKCYLISYGILNKNKMESYVDLHKMYQIICDKMDKVICKDSSKYGVEYVSAPSDFFIGINKEFITEEITKLIKVEREALGKLQNDDGGFDISWQWCTGYKEFEQARKWWRPRVTIDKLLFWESNNQL